MMKKKRKIIFICCFLTKILFSSYKITDYASIKPINLQRNWFSSSNRNQIALINKCSSQSKLASFLKQEKKSIDIQYAILYQSSFLLYKSLIKIIDSYDEKLKNWKSIGVKPLTYLFKRGPFRWFESRSVKSEIDSYIDILQEYRNKYLIMLFRLSYILSKMRSSFNMGKDKEKNLPQFIDVINNIFERSDSYVNNSFQSLINFLEFTLYYETEELKKVNQHGLPSHLQKNLTSYLITGFGCCIFFTYYLNNKGNVKNFGNQFKKRVVFFYHEIFKKIKEIQNILVGKELETEDVFLQHCQRVELDAKKKVEEIVKFLYPNLSGQELKTKICQMWNSVYVNSQSSVLDVSYKKFEIPYFVDDHLYVRINDLNNIVQKKTDDSNDFVITKWVSKTVQNGIENTLNGKFDLNSQETKESIVVFVNKFLNEYTGFIGSKIAKEKLLYEAFLYIHTSKIMNLFLYFKKTIDKTYDENRLTMLLISSVPIGIFGWGIYKCLKKVYDWRFSKNVLYKNIRLILFEITNVLIDCFSRDLTEKEHGTLLYLFDKLEKYSQELGHYDFEEDLKSLLSFDNKLERVKTMRHRYSFLK